MNVREANDGEHAQVGDDGALVRRVDGVGWVSGGLVEGVVPLRRTVEINNEHV